jgi:valyl-tRNA synthetase
MSKSLGNSPDPLELKKIWCRWCSRWIAFESAGNDIMFDEELCNQGKVYQ